MVYQTESSFPPIYSADFQKVPYLKAVLKETDPFAFSLQKISVYKYVPVFLYTSGALLLILQGPTVSAQN